MIDNCDIFSLKICNDLDCYNSHEWGMALSKKILIIYFEPEYLEIKVCFISLLNKVLIHSIELILKRETLLL